MCICISTGIESFNQMFAIKEMISNRWDRLQKQERQGERKTLTRIGIALNMLMDLSSLIRFTKSFLRYFDPVADYVILLMENCF